VCHLWLYQHRPLRAHEARLQEWRHVVGHGRTIAPVESPHEHEAPVPHLQLTLDIGARDPAPYEDLLFALGAISITLADAADDPVLEPAPGATPLWPTVELRALFAEGTEPAATVSAIERMLPGAPTPRVETVADQAWERVWLQDFRPMQFGRRLWICPGGQDAGAPDAIRIELDPGLAFGTGTHPTTALCLEWLDGQSLAGRQVVDYGCGSGILAIAAAKLGAARVFAVDIDPQAVIATRENAARNHVADRLNISTEPRLAPRGADVLIANILAGPLVELAPSFAAALRPQGGLALSGLLSAQSDSVTAAYRPCFDIDTSTERDGWVLLGGRRRAD
jgi:ribosomal protein L11 methyltransferase